MDALIRLALLPIVLILTCSLASAQAEPARPRSHITIPFVLQRGEIYVDTFVNGQGPFRFVVDTGASGAGRVDSRLVAKLRLQITGTTTNSDSVNTAAIDTVSLSSLRIGTLQQHGVEVLSRDYNQGVPAGEELFLGIIGRDFFSARILTIDYPKRELRVAEGSLPESETNTEGYGEPFLLPIRIGEHPTVGNLDTGSNLQMHLPLEWASRLGVRSLEEAGEGRRANTVFKLFRATLPVPVHIAGNALTGVDARFSERATRINIGGALLAEKACVVAIDQAAKIVRMRCNDGGAG